MRLECRVLSTIEDVDPVAWDACAGNHPFVRHAFLKALEISGALVPERGVIPRYVLLKEASLGLVACAPAMLKWGNLREFGPEIRWLREGLRAGCFAWPKFQIGLPYFPVMGPKLLVRPNLPEMPLRIALLNSVYRVGQRLNPHSVCNVLHVDEADAWLCEAQGALLSHEWHSMWVNPGFADLSAYLAHLPDRKRYEFIKERRQAESHGLTFKVLRGTDLNDEVLADYYEGHRRVCLRYGGMPWLPAETYAKIGAALRDEILLMGYFDGERFVAGSMKLQSISEQTIYSLQWSEMEKLKGVAFDLICRRPIDYAIQHGIRKLDSGLAAPHKRHRGWTDVRVNHAHWFYSGSIKALAESQLAKLVY